MRPKIDDTDRKILQTLQLEPDLSVQALADRINLSHTPCWRRLKRLEAEGVILGRSTVIDPAAVDLPITVFAEVKLKQHDEPTLEAFERAAERCPEVLECFSMSGEHDYIFRIVAHSIGEYEVFLKKSAATFARRRPRSTAALR